MLTHAGVKFLRLPSGFLYVFKRVSRSRGLPITNVHLESRGSHVKSKPSNLIRSISAIFKLCVEHLRAWRISKPRLALTKALPGQHVHKGHQIELRA